MNQWYRYIADEFPLGAVLFFLVVVGGGFFFKDEIQDFVKDQTRKAQEIQHPSEPAAKRAQYSPGNDKVVYTVSHDDSRLMLI